MKKRVRQIALVSGGEIYLVQVNNNKNYTSVFLKCFPLPDAHTHADVREYLRTSMRAVACPNFAALRK